MPPIADEVRRALDADPRPDAEIAAAAGIHAVSLSRFRTGTRGLSVESLEQLAAALGRPILLSPPKKPRTNLTK